MGRKPTAQWIDYVCKHEQHSAIQTFLPKKRKIIHDGFFNAFLSRDDDNPRIVNWFRSTLNAEQNQLAIKVSADN